MKKIVLFITVMLVSFYGMAQKKSAFPFRGGKENMIRFFKDSLVVSPAIIQEKATGLVVFKFTADDEGNLTKIVVYYADDAVLVQPIIDVLKKSNHKWILPDHERLNDFIIPFSYSFTQPATPNKGIQKAVYDYISHRKPIYFTNQLLLDTAANLLPTIMINYDIPQ